MSNNQKFNAVFNKEYKNVMTRMLPISYFDFKLLKISYPNIFPTDIDGELGYLKVALEVYPTDTTDNDLSQYIENLNNKDIIPVFKFPIYIPMFNFKPNCDSKNIFRYVYLYIMSLNVYYMQYIKNDNSFISPSMDGIDKNKLTNNHIKFINKIIRDENIINKIYNDIGAIVDSKEFLNCNFKEIEKEYFLEKFLEPLSDLEINENDRISHQNTFINYAQTMYTIIKG